MSTFSFFFVRFRQVDGIRGSQYLHCLLRALRSRLSERSLHLHGFLGYGAQKLFAAACLRVILSKLRKKITMR